MNRPIIITIGIVILLLMLGLWGYLLAYGTPQKATDVFTNLGFFAPSEQTVRTIDVNGIQENTTTLALGGSPLQQLTTRAVAGFGYASDKGDLIRYVEAGTGHIYEINLQNGTERQISVTTIPQTIDAVFSVNAQAIAITTQEGYKGHVVAGFITGEEDTIELIELPQNSQNLAFKDDTTLYYSLSTGGKTHGYSMDLTKNESTLLFSLTLADATLRWGGRYTSMLAQSKPTQHLPGYVYEIVNGSLKPFFIEGYGLSAFGSDEYTIISNVQEGVYVTNVLRGDNTWSEGIIMLKEKCASGLESQELWCAAPLEVLPPSYIENWYKGTITSNDHLWYTRLTEESSELTVDLAELAGHTVDVDRIEASIDGSSLIFRNKIDNSLWIYRIAPQAPVVEEQEEVPQQ